MTYITWKDVVGYEGYYKVSNLGRVKSLDRITKRNSNTVRKIKGKMLKPFTPKNNYKRYSLCKGSYIKNITSHRLVLDAFIGINPGGMQGSHMDGNPLNNNANNLRWESCSDNNLRKKDHGTNNDGESNCLSKLTNNKVLEIRKIYSRGNITYREIAGMFNITKPNVGYIVNRKTWRHI